MLALNSKDDTLSLLTTLRVRALFCLTAVVDTRLSDKLSRDCRAEFYKHRSGKLLFISSLIFLNVIPVSLMILTMNGPITALIGRWPTVYKYIFNFYTRTCQGSHHYILIYIRSHRLNIYYPI
jgi:hypothetical protein